MLNEGTKDAIRDTMKMTTPNESMSASEDDLEIRNTQDRKCPICYLKILSQYDRDIFFRRMGFDSFSEVANAAGYTIPQVDFDTHRKSHIYVYIPAEEEGDVPSDKILVDTIGQLRKQLDSLEKSGHTSSMEYTKKLDILKSLIELKGKFDGAYVQKFDVSTDFKARLLAQVANVKEKETTTITIPAAPTKDVPPQGKISSPPTPLLDALEPEKGVNERIEDLERRAKKPVPR